MGSSGLAGGGGYAGVLQGLGYQVSGIARIEVQVELLGVKLDMTLRRAQRF